MSSRFKPGQIIGGGAPESKAISIIFRVDKDNGDGTYDVTGLTGAGATFLLEPHKHLATNKNAIQGGISVKIKYEGEIPENYLEGKMTVKELSSFMSRQVALGITQ